MGFNFTFLLSLISFIPLQKYKIRNTYIYNNDNKNRFLLICFIYKHINQNQNYYTYIKHKYIFNKLSLYKPSSDKIYKVQISKVTIVSTVSRFIIDD